MDITAITSDLTGADVDTSSADDTTLDTSSSDTDTSSSSDDSSDSGDGSDATGDDTTDASTDGTGDDNAAPPDTKDEVLGDGRTIPAKYKQLFKEHKDLRAMYFEAQAFKKAFATPAAAAELVANLDSLGGLDGIQAERAEFAEIDRMFSEGDPKSFEKWVSNESNAAGFTKLAPAILDTYRKNDEAGWTHEMAKVMSSTLNEAGFGSALNSLYALVKDNPEAVKILQGIAGFAGGIDKLAKEAPKPTTDPARAKLDKDRADFEKQKADQFNQEVSAAVAPLLSKGVEKNLIPYFKGKKPDTASYELMQNNVLGELAKLLQNDKTYQAQIKSVQASKDKARITKFMQAAIDRHMPAAAKTIARAFSLGGASAAAPKAQGTPAPGTAAAQKLNAPPDPDTVDYRKTTKEMIANGKAVLIGGKVVTFD